MRAVIQRVAEASVVVDGVVVGSIGKGLAILIGICGADTQADLAYVVNRCLACRLWDGPDGRAWGASAQTTGLPVLLVSQFTLYAGTRKPKPDFHRAMGADAARDMWACVVDAFRKAHPKGAEGIATGTFQAMMSVKLTNDGPVTVIVDSKNKDDELPQGL